MSLFMYDAAFAPNLAACKARGAVAMSHYLTGTYGGTSAQPRAIRAAGMGAVFNWERDPGALIGASREQGRNIAVEALAAIDPAAPRGKIACYFSVDKDVLNSRLGSCDQGFLGIRDVLGTAVRPAVYGELGLIDHLVSSRILTGKHWLSMSEGFSAPGTYDPASPNVCLVQMHDIKGNWIGTDVPGTDRNTVTDAHALGAWWPDNSPYIAPPPAPPAPNPIPIPDVQEDDMVLFITPPVGGSAPYPVLVCGPVCVVVGHKSSADALKAAGAKVVTLPADDYANIRKQATR